jgi:adenylate kinase
MPLISDRKAAHLKRKRDMEELKRIKERQAKEKKPEQPPPMYAMVFSRSGVKIVKNQKKSK